MPPRGPISLAREEAERLVCIIEAVDSLKSLVEKLHLSLSDINNVRQLPHRLASPMNPSNTHQCVTIILLLQSVCTVVAKEEECEDILDRLEAHDTIR